LKKFTIVYRKLLMNYKKALELCKKYSWVIGESLKIIGENLEITEKSFRDYREEFRDFAKRTDENFKLILNKYGEISEKLTILETLVKESKEIREMLNETMKLLKEALEKISSR
jgi:5-bromo-4-chloroindolyl phosphate hydrolysis protein